MYRQTKISFGPGKMSPGIKWLLIITTGFFVLQLFFGLNNPGNPIHRFFILVPYDRSTFFPWQPISYMFLHGDFFHILFNMFGLWMFGIMYEKQFGTIKLLQLYFISGIMVGLIYAFFLNFGGLLGASAGIYAIFVSYAYFWPNSQILVFGIFPLKAKFMVLILMVIGLASSFGLDPTDKTAHLGHIMGAAIGFIYLQIVHRRYQLFGSLFHSVKNKINTASFKREEKKTQQVVDKEQWSKDKVDELLEKVSKYGIKSLTKKEKEFLDKVSMNYNRSNDDKYNY
ncbi:MAG: rhomboid family intramembrane serine protease [Spirochaetota bacterium]|nr:rhomboid family intramembrane serine protease [Spirochaetota bacterium]